MVGACVVKVQLGGVHGTVVVAPVIIIVIIVIIIVITIDIIIIIIAITVIIVIVTVIIGLVLVNIDMIIVTNFQIFSFMLIILILPVSPNTRSMYLGIN